MRPYSQEFAAVKTPSIGRKGSGRAVSWGTHPGLAHLEPDVPATAIIIFMPVIESLQMSSDITGVHMGVVVIVTLAFGLIAPTYGLSLLLTSMLAGVRFTQAVMRSLPICVVFPSSLRSSSGSPNWCCGFPAF